MKKKNLSFPLRIKRGSVTVSVYKETAGPYTRYAVARYEGLSRKRLRFTSLDEAVKEAEEAACRLSQGQGEGVTLSREECFVYERAKTTLKPLGMPLDVAALQLSEALRILQGKATLVEAAKRFVKSEQTIVPKRVSVVVAELLAARRKENCSDLHVNDLDSRLTRFANAFKCDIHVVTAPEIQDFLHGLKVAPRSANNFRTAISNLFSFAKFRGYLPKDSTIIEEVRPFKEVAPTVGIYSPEDLTKMLKVCDPKFVPFVTIGAFAGLRSSEIARLDWRDVRANYIHIVPADQPTKSVRVVPIPQNLQQWLALYRTKEGLVVPFKNPANFISALPLQAGVKRRTNGLRHSFGSYRCALTNDMARVANEMGNSVGMVKRHYLEVVEPPVADAWFSIIPSASAETPALEMPAPQEQAA